MKSLIQKTVYALSALAMGTSPVFASEEVLRNSIQEMVKDADHLLEILDFEYVVASPWREVPKRNQEKFHLEVEKEAINSYQRLIQSTPSLAPLSEAMEWEDNLLCKQLKVYKSKERSEKRTRRQSSRSSYYFNSEVRASFGSYLRVKDLGKVSLSGRGKYRKQIKDSYRSSSYSNYQLYEVSREVYCSKEVTIRRAVIRITPDLVRLDPQLFAKIVTEQYKPKKAAFIELLQDTNERLLTYSQSKLAITVLSPYYCTGNSYRRQIHGQDYYRFLINGKPSKVICVTIKITLKLILTRDKHAIGSLKSAHKLIALQYSLFLMKTYFLSSSDFKKELTD